MRLLTHSLIFVFCVLTVNIAAAQETDDTRANKLLVEALLNVQKGEDETPIKKLSLYGKAVSLIERLVREHPGSEIAVKIITGQKIGSFDFKELKTDYQLAFGEVCLENPRPECASPLAMYAKDLNNQLVGALEKTKSANQELKQKQKEAERDQARIDLLKRQVDALRQQMARIAYALEDSEAKAKEQRVQIADLGRRLNLALAGMVEELSRISKYRLEFFGRLREVLGNQPGVRVVGDRFEFQSEVLFASGSAELASEGEAKLTQLAETLKDIGKKIPEDINWILHVDGHTDRVPILTPAFPSNWELSTARATSVVKFLASKGIPPERLAATGFGEYQPIDLRDDEIGYRRNRRIEFRLTQR